MTPPELAVSPRRAAFLERYRRDASEPTRGSVARDVALRGLVPAAGLLALVVLAGWVITGPLGGLPGEEGFNQALQAARTPTLDAAALAVSHAAGVVGAPLVAVVSFVVLRRRTGQWWVALVPLISVALEALVYQTAAVIVGRRRPQGVEQLDFGGASFSFPSGHVGATMCLGLVFTWLAWGSLSRTGRVLSVAALLLACLLVALSRLYLGMHHPSDALAGMVVGALAAAIGWRVIRRGA